MNRKYHIGSLVPVLLFLLSSATVFGQIKPTGYADFSGTWVLKPKSRQTSGGEFHELYKNLLPKQLILYQTKDSIQIERVLGTDIGDMTTRETILFNGKPDLDTAADGGIRIRTYYWNDQLQHLTLTARFYVKGDSSKPENKVIEHWSLYKGELILKNEIVDGSTNYYSAVYERR